MCVGAVCAGEEARLRCDISNDKQRDCVWRPFQRDGLSSYHRCVHILQPPPSQNSIASIIHIQTAGSNRGNIAAQSQKLWQLMSAAKRLASS